MVFMQTPDIQGDIAELLSALDNNAFRTSFDLIGIASFFVVALVYFLAPALGYRFERRLPLLMSLYVLLGFVGVAAVHGLLFGMRYYSWDEHTFSEANVHFALASLKGILFFLALLLFVVGLQNLRSKSHEPDETA